MNRCLAVGTVLLLGICAGCGTKRYEDRLEQTVQRLGKESAFSGMQPPTQLEGTPVTVRLPRFFTSPPLPEESDARRLKLPAIDLPDLKSTYEGSITDSGGGQIPFYCYLAATKKDPERKLRQEVQETFPGAVLKLEEVDCKTPDGGTSRWKRLRGAQGEGKDQEFYYVDKDGQGGFRRMPAKVLFYLRQQGDFFVIIGWRLPISIEKLIGVEGDLGLEQWAPRVAGSVTVKK